MKKKYNCPWCKKKINGSWQYEMHVQYNHYKTKYDKKSRMFI